MRALRRPFSRLFLAALGAAAGAWVGAAGCGARSELLVPRLDAGEDAPPPSPGFCETALFDSGPTGLSLLVLLDRSDSMIGERWASATAALAAFAADPQAAGLGFGLQYFPLHEFGDTCIEEEYASPSVPMAKLPQGAAQVASSLAATWPVGETPTLPALRGAIQYARAVALANPAERLVVALVTDGAPNACASTAENVAAAAAEAAASDPKVLTAVIGLATGYNEDLAQVAAAGGAGKLIVVGDGAGAAQQLVDAMVGLELALESCTYGVPQPSGASPAASDLSLEVRADPAAPWVALPRVAGFGSCAGDAFYADDDLAPGVVTLCPAACAAQHASAASQVRVTAGCGEGSDAGPPPDGGTVACPPNVDFACVDACLAPTVNEAPSCIDGAWTCPPGTFADDSCDTCPAVPHGCCVGDGSFVQASCLAGAWTCPPGATLFGEPGCASPDVCTASLPCPFGSLCDLPDDSCGAGALLGTCHPTPGACDPASPPACGCDGATYPDACAAGAAGQDLAAAGGCPPPAGRYSCGPWFCALGTEVCRKTQFLSTGAPDAWDCVAIPPGCGDGCGCPLCEQCPPSGPCGLCDPQPGGVVGLTCNEL